MDKDSRTAKALKNSGVAILFYFINLILQFYSRKIFLNCLGTEILGLNSTALNLLQFLNLAELGISSAVGFTLYKPLHNRDVTVINEIVTLQGLLYRRIAWFIVAGAGVLMAFFPLIFSKIDIPMWYTYASFGVLLFSALLGYFVNYRQIVLTSDQKDYKVLLSYKSVMMIKVLAQMFAVYYFSDGYVWWLILEALFAIIGSYTLYYITAKEYPFLRNTKQSFVYLKHKYPDFTKKIKQLFFHKIGAFALTQSSPLIIYAYASLTMVALYGNYFLIITGVQMLVIAIFNSTNAGIGNLVAQGDNKHIKIVFEQLFGIRFLIVTVLAVSTIILTNDFVALWIGREYILPKSTLLIMVGIFYINVFRFTVDSFLNAYGLYQDIWAPIIESVLNIGLSIIFGYFWGLNGILTGVLVSLILIIAIWKPIFLFRNSKFWNLKGYIALYLKHILVLLIATSVGYMLYSHIQIGSSDWIAFAINGIIVVALFGATICGGIVLINRPMLQFIKKLKS